MYKVEEIPDEEDIEKKPEPLQVESKKE